MARNLTAAEAKPMLTRKRLIVASVAIVLVAGLSLWAFQMLEQFLIRDQRFTVASLESARALRISGAAHASVRSIENVFADDYGRSLYLVPLDERLTTLRAVDWVRDASIARVWPNRIMVNVTERTPVAFVTLPPSRFALIDAEGVILPTAKDQFNLPVLRGVKTSDSLESRAKSVARMSRLLTDLGDAAKEISEIDIADPENVAISKPHQGHVVKLLLGDRDFARRFQTFQNHVSEIDERVPGAKVLDLRLDDRITVVEGGEE
jgi:cell division protein FtsQ